MSSTSLRCSEARDAMVADTVAGPGVGAPALDVERHLQVCASCARFAAGLRLAQDLFADGPEVSPELHQRALIAALAARSSERPPVGVLAGAALVAVIGLVAPMAAAAWWLGPWIGSAGAAWAAAAGMVGFVGLAVVAGSMVLLAVARGGVMGSILTRGEV